MHSTHTCACARPRRLRAHARRADRREAGALAHGARAITCRAHRRLPLCPLSAASRLAAGGACTLAGLAIARTTLPPARAPQSLDTAKAAKAAKEEKATAGGGSSSWEYKIKRTDEAVHGAQGLQPPLCSRA